MMTQEHRTRISAVGLALAISLFAADGSLAAPAPNPNTATPVPAKKGAARISCVVNKVGRLEQCEVVFEDPKGQGFGEAALMASKDFQIPPERDGVSTAGGKFATTIYFDAKPATGAKP